MLLLERPKHAALPIHDALNRASPHKTFVANSGAATTFTTVVLRTHSEATQLIRPQPRPAFISQVVLRFCTARTAVGTTDHNQPTYNQSTMQYVKQHTEQLVSIPKCKATGRPTHCQALTYGCTWYG